MTRTLSALVLAAGLVGCGGNTGKNDNGGGGGGGSAGTGGSGGGGGDTSSADLAIAATQDLGSAHDLARAADLATPPPASILLDVPWVGQNPELPRGCEVTSLTMLLRDAGIASADKMTLAQQVDKVPYQYPGGLYGNPNDGFVGDMYTFANPGYGVYHAPVERLAEKYLPGRVVKLTGVPFDHLLGEYVGRKHPVWIITNATWKRLDPATFTTWQTKEGPIQITWHEHSVVITGYDPTSVFINDPLDASAGKNKRLARADFQAAWEQMGSQALSYTP